MSRTIDHLVLASRNLAHQAAFFARLGFQVGPENRHPWGTINRIVQFENVFLELISTGQGFRAPVDLPADQFSFAGFVHASLQQREGAVMLALTTQNAAADRRAFHASQIGDYETFHFARQGRSSDGAPVQVEFTLAFAHSSLMAEAGFFTCQHHYPENFWSPALRQHDNGASHLAGVMIVADNPSDHGAFLSHLTGVRDFRASSLGLFFDLAQQSGQTLQKQTLDVLTPLAFEQRFGAPAPAAATHTPLLAAVAIDGCDLAAMADRCAQQGIEFRQKGSFIVVPPEQAFGVTLVFG